MSEVLTGRCLFLYGAYVPPVTHTYCGHHSYNQTGHHHNSKMPKIPPGGPCGIAFLQEKRKKEHYELCLIHPHHHPLNNQRFWITNIRVCRLPQHQLTTDNQNIMCLHSFIHSCMLSHCEENAVWDQELCSI